MVKNTKIRKDNSKTRKVLSQTRSVSQSRPKVSNSIYKKNLMHMQNKYTAIASAKRESLDNLTREERMLWKLEHHTVDLTLGTYEEYMKLKEQQQVQEFLEELKE